MFIKKISQVLWPYYLYLILVIFYFLLLTTKFLEYLDLTGTIFNLLVFYLPLPLTVYASLKTKVIFKPATLLIVFMFSWFIGLAPGILLGYGLYSLSHSIYIINLVKSLLFFGLIYSVICGIIGILLYSVYIFILRHLK